MSEIEIMDGYLLCNNDEIQETSFEFLDNFTYWEMDELWDEHKQRMRKIYEENREVRRQKKEVPAIWWLAKELNIHPADLKEMLDLVRKNTHAYETKYIPKPNGEKRELQIPIEGLKTIQKRINKYIVRFLRVSLFVSGFSGGSILDAIKPHLESKSIFCLDIKDAFPTIKFGNIFEYLTTGRDSWRAGQNFEIVKVRYGWFSWYAARILVALTTFRGKLPQGAPTSPRIFDLIFEPIDNELSKLAQKVKGQYTRYADNIFFSVKEDYFPQVLRREIEKTIENSRDSGPAFWWHKTKIKSLNGKEPLRILGLNVKNRNIYNTRDFKKHLRLTIHHTKWLLDNNMRETLEFEKAWRKLQGQMQFAIKDTLPKTLLDSYLELEKRVL